ncbi:hypothetical protein IVA77_00125 [Bradyrhizobium sp. 136]|nr:hypothetical protein [Bradyrhizobium sp. 163]MCK1760038.1 hypothetical protein [Bradyrhizobium sp. 136]
MFLNAELLPHVSPMARERRGSDEAIGYGDAQATEVCFGAALSSHVEKSRILDEFVAIAGLDRKHAMRLLRFDPDGQRKGHRHRARIYQDAERNALILFWEAADRV